MNKRHDVTPIFGTLKHIDAVEVINVSPKDMTIACQTQLLQGKLYHFHLSSGGRTIEIQGTADWCSHVRTIITENQKVQPIYNARINLEQMDPEPAQALQDFLADSLMITLKRRIKGSMDAEQLETAYSADMDSTYIFQIEKLSPSGMILKTNFQPALESHCEMEIQLDRQNLSLKVQVLSAEKLDKNYQLRVQFIDPTERDLVAIRDYLRRISDES